VRTTVVEDWLDHRIEITDRDDLDPWKRARIRRPAMARRSVAPWWRVGGGAEGLGLQQAGPKDAGRRLVIDDLDHVVEPVLETLARTRW